MRLVLFAALLAPGAPALAQVATAPTAAIAAASGSTQLQLRGSDVWFLARPGRALPAGSVLKTAADSSCALAFSDGSRLRVGPLANVRLAELTPERTTLSLGAGKLEASVPQRERAEFRIMAPLFTATLPEGVLSAEILSEASATLDVFAGTAAVVDSQGRSVQVGPGQRTELGAQTGASTPAPLPAAAVRPKERKPAKAVKRAAPEPAQPAAREPEPAAKKAKPAEPPPPAKSAYKDTDSQL
ncbi:MAG: FecR domain-containing protein [Elusimicrobia bacterium]|nr:FecR domain-containing protein [Elusimicrobiota bacterium]